MLLLAAVQCILQWATHKASPYCPQCKVPFEFLHTYRQLDGTLSDFPVEENICLLKRAKWFVAHVEAQEQERLAAAHPGAPGARRSDNYLDFYDDFEEQDDDEEIEDFYFSSAAGERAIPAPIVIWCVCVCVGGAFVVCDCTSRRPFP